MVLKLRLLLMLSGVKGDVRNVCAICCWLNRRGIRQDVAPIEHNLVPVQVAVHRVLPNVVQGLMLSLLLRQLVHQGVRLGDCSRDETIPIKWIRMRH